MNPLSGDALADLKFAACALRMQGSVGRAMQVEAGIEEIERLRAIIDPPPPPRKRRERKQETHHA